MSDSSSLQVFDPEGSDRRANEVFSLKNKKRVTGKVLGSLESEVMEIIWRQKDTVSVKDITETLSKKRQIAYTTVMTIMTRLVEKQVLERHLEKQSYLYKPRVSRDQFLSKAVHGIFSTAVSTLGNEALAHFVKEIEKLSPKKRQELLKILGED